MDVFIYRDFLTVAKVAVAFIDYQVFSLGRGIKPIVGKIFSLYTVNIDKRSNILSGRFKLFSYHPSGLRVGNGHHAAYLLVEVCLANLDVETLGGFGGKSEELVVVHENGGADFTCKEIGDVLKIAARHPCLGVDKFFEILVGNFDFLVLQIFAYILYFGSEVGEYALAIFAVKPACQFILFRVKEHIVDGLCAELRTEAKRTLDGHGVIAEFVCRENLCRDGGILGSLTFEV